MLYQTLNVYGVRSVRYVPPEAGRLGHLRFDLRTNNDGGTAMIVLDLAGDASDELVSSLTAAFAEPGVELRPAERIAREEADVLDSVDTAGLVNR